jgi:hypothetical protein
MVRRKNAKAGNKPSRSAKKTSKRKPELQTEKAQKMTLKSYLYFLFFDKADERLITGR